MYSNHEYLSRFASNPRSRECSASNTRSKVCAAPSDYSENALNKWNSLYNLLRCLADWNLLNSFDRRDVPDRRDDCNAKTNSWRIRIGFRWGLRERRFSTLGSWKTGSYRSPALSPHGVLLGGVRPISRIISPAAEMQSSDGKRPTAAAGDGRAGTAKTRSLSSTLPLN